MYEAILIVYLLVAIVLIIFIMLQHGKGADMGASFGAGASNTVFGSAGTGNFLTKTTTILAIIFFGICLFIGNMNTHRDTATGSGKFDNLTQEAEMQELPITAPLEIPNINPNDIPE